MSWMIDDNMKIFIIFFEAEGSGGGKQASGRSREEKT